MATGTLKTQRPGEMLDVDVEDLLLGAGCPEDVVLGMPKIGRPACIGVAEPHLPDR